MEDQLNTATSLVRCLGYRKGPRPPLRTLQLLRDTYVHYLGGTLDDSVAAVMDEDGVPDSIIDLLNACDADNLLRNLARASSAKGTGSTSSQGGHGTRGSQVLTEIPSGVTRTDFQRQLAQTFQDSSAVARDFRAAREAMRDPPKAPRPSYNTWQNMAAGAQAPATVAPADPAADPEILAPQPIRTQEPGILQLPPLPPQPNRPDLYLEREAMDQPRRDRAQHRRERGDQPQQEAREAAGPARGAYYPAPAIVPALQLPPPEPPSPLTREELQLALSRENKLNIRTPDSFTGKDRRKWKSFLAECLMTFAAKPNTYWGQRPKVTFAVSYLTELAQRHYVTLLQYQPNHPALYSWGDFVTEFGNMFSNPNGKLEAERALTRSRMRDRDNFNMHLTYFETHAYESGWNFEALRYALQQSLPRRLKNALANMEHRPETYQELRCVIANLDQAYWESLADDDDDNG